MTLHICATALKPLQNGVCVVYSLCLGAVDMEPFREPCFNVLWPSQVYPGWGWGLRGAPHSSAERTEVPLLDPKRFKVRGKEHSLLHTPHFNTPVTELFPQQQVVEINYSTTPLPKKVSLNLPCDRSSKNNPDWRVNPVKRQLLKFLSRLPNASTELRSSVKTDEVGKYDEMSLHFLPRLQQDQKCSTKLDTRCIVNIPQVTWRTDARQHGAKDRLLKQWPTQWLCCSQKQLLIGFSPFNRTDMFH